MKHKQISLRSAAEVLAFVADPKSALKLNESDTLLFRGERQRYPKIAPSVARWPKEDQIHLEVLATFFAYQVLIDMLGPFLEFRNEGPYYKGKWIGRVDWHDAYRDGPSYIAIKWQLESLLQHYGWPTPWLDVTFDPEVAIFFACFDFATKEFVTRGRGYFYIWSFRELGGSPLYLDVPVVDLEPIATVLSDALSVQSTRPRAQAAGSLGIRSGVLRVAQAVLKELRTTVVFERKDVVGWTRDYDHYFPKDSLLDALDKLETLYIEDCHRASPSSVGAGWPDYLKFLDRWKAEKTAKISLS